jgi:hypothetical protein
MLGSVFKRLPQVSQHSSVYMLRGFGVPSTFQPGYGNFTNSPKQVALNVTQNGKTGPGPAVKWMPVDEFAE